MVRSRATAPYQPRLEGRKQALAHVSRRSTNAPPRIKRLISISPSRLSISSVRQNSTLGCRADSPSRASSGWAPRRELTAALPRLDEAVDTSLPPTKTTMPLELSSARTTHPSVATRSHVKCPGLIPTEGAGHSATEVYLSAASPSLMCEPAATDRWGPGELLCCSGPLAEEDRRRPSFANRRHESAPHCLWSFGALWRSPGISAIGSSRSVRGDWAYPSGA